ncbi:MAG: enoyl-CoA hydratase/isomerase family protein [Bacteroidetes bacterium]|nr:enoyl-CoA hydratase/isomerase family protein [Bacteroidota bacterium]MBL6963190.1 enoyl-CoA hydratase/isomerase family protein [Bacteroidota bacterium]
MQKIKFEYQYDNSVARIILDDGKGNVLDNIMMNELIDLLSSFKSKKDIKLITFEGAGKNFSYGASVEEHTKDKAEEMLKTFHKIFHTLIDLHIPTLAKISGQCLGGGFELPLMCNFIFADQTAKVGQPEILLGVFAPPASIILPLKIGNSKAEELLITGRIIGAEEAKKIGLINDVFEDRESMDNTIKEWIEKYILGKSASSLRHATEAARASFDHVMKRELDHFTELFLDKLMETHDANEGINSFMEKRPPVWKNC